MPVMDGFEASRRIRAFEDGHDLRRAMIIALTAHTSHAAAQLPRWEAAGFDVLLRKPISPHVFQDHISGPADTSLVLQYGCLTGEEKRSYLLRRPFPRSTQPVAPPGNEVLLRLYRDQIASGARALTEFSLPMQQILYPPPIVLFRENQHALEDNNNNMM